MIGWTWSLASCLTTLLLLLAASGCGRAATDEDSARLEHHVPEHKPATFALGVEEVQRRGARLLRPAATADAPANEPPFSELLDIIDWLPELAADTDLKKPDWDRVNTAAHELKSLVEPLAGSNAPGTISNFSQWERAVEELNQVVARLPALGMDWDSRRDISPGSSDAATGH